MPPAQETPFERFTDRSKAVLTLAQQEAETAGHAWIGTEHLLLGLLRDQAGIACAALNAMGVELEPTRETIRAMLSRQGPAPVERIVPTSRVKRVVEISFEEARRMGQPFVGTQHLLFGLLVEGEGIAAHVLRDMGVSVDRARAEVDRLLRERPSEPVSPTQGTALGATSLPLQPELRRLMAAASAAAAGRGSSSVGLDHLLDAMISSAGIEALARLLDLRRVVAAREQAIASQRYEDALQHRTEEKQAREALERALADWRAELQPPAQNGP